jgi:hypothetical protein
MDIVSECEMPSKRQEFLLISDREVEALNNSQKARDKIERLFSESEANLLLDNVNVVNSIFETMKVYFGITFIIVERSILFPLNGMCIIV